MVGVEFEAAGQVLLGLACEACRGFSLVLYKIAISIIKLELQEKTGKLL